MLTDERVHRCLQCRFICLEGRNLCGNCIRLDRFEYLRSKDGKDPVLLEHGCTVHIELSSCRIGRHLRNESVYVRRGCRDVQIQGSRVRRRERLGSCDVGGQSAQLAYAARKLCFKQLLIACEAVRAHRCRGEPGQREERSASKYCAS